MLSHILLNDLRVALHKDAVKVLSLIVSTVSQQVKIVNTIIIVLSFVSVTDNADV